MGKRVLDKIAKRNFARAERLVDKLLHDPVGRLAMGRKMGLDINLVENQNVPQVAVLVPSYKMSPHPRMKAAGEAAFREAQKVATIFYPPAASSCVVHWARNLLIAELVKSGRRFTHVLFCDDDIVMPPDAVVKMLSHNVDIVGALCTTRTDPPVPNIHSDLGNGVIEKMLDWPGADGPGGLIEVGSVGTGLMLISEVALRRLTEFYINGELEKALWCKYFGVPDDHPKWEQLAKDRMKSFDESGNGWWFQFFPQTQLLTSEHGEDVGFCVKARMAGLKVHCDTSIQPEHIGEYGFSFKDYLPHRDKARAVAATAKKPGRLKIIDTEEDPS